MHVTNGKRSEFSKVEEAFRDNIAKMRRQAERDRKTLSDQLIGPARTNGITMQNAPSKVSHPRITRIDDAITSSSMYIQRMDELRAELTALGLEPFAVLPGMLWDKLTVDFGTYRYDNFDYDGRVPANALTFIDRLRIRSMSDATLLKVLWPQKHDTISDGIRIHPTFPLAPQSFQEKMERLNALAQKRQFPVGIAAAPEAIAISRDEVLRAHQEHDLPKAMQPTPHQDPILFTRRTHPDASLVALLDFYGNFPEEERLVEYSKNWMESLR